MHIHNPPRVFRTFYSKSGKPLGDYSICRTVSNSTSFDNKQMSNLVERYQFRSDLSNAVESGSLKSHIKVIIKSKQNCKKLECFLQFCCI